MALLRPFPRRCSSQLTPLNDPGSARTAFGVDRLWQSAQHPRRLAVVLTVCLLVPQPACDRAGPPPQEEYRILRVLPHDAEGYTQGLVFLDGRLFESTGQYGRSSVRELDPASGAVLRSRSLGEEYFAEGLAAVRGELVQLTWKEGVAFVIDPRSLDVVRTYGYEGEGWGLCFDGTTVFMSNGTDTLYRRDPESFAIVGRLPVTKAGFPLSRLNELECVGQTILANVFLSDDIVRIDKTTGHVTGIIDGYGLAGSGRRPDDPNAVLNGIAYEPTRGTLFVTGKLWPSLLEIALAGEHR